MERIIEEIRRRTKVLGRFPSERAALKLVYLDQLWIADITYIRLPREFVYLAVLLDAFSRRCIGWALERYLDTELTLAALRMALAKRAVQPVRQRAGGEFPQDPEV